MEPNRKKYEQISEPYETEEDAAQAVTGFLDEISRLRETHRVAEIVLMCGVWLETGERTKLFPFRFSAGDSRVLYTMAKELELIEARDLAEASRARFEEDGDASNG